MKFEVKRMTIASMRGVRPEQIEVMAHADDSRVTTASVKALRRLASHTDQVGARSKAAIETLTASIRSPEIRRRVGL